MKRCIKGMGRSLGGRRWGEGEGEGVEVWMLVLVLVLVLVCIATGLDWDGILLSLLASTRICRAWIKNGKEGA